MLAVTLSMGPWTLSRGLGPFLDDDGAEVTPLQARMRCGAAFWPLGAINFPWRDVNRPGGDGLA